MYRSLKFQNIKICRHINSSVPYKPTKYNLTLLNQLDRMSVLTLGKLPLNANNISFFLPMIPLSTVSLSSSIHLGTTSLFGANTLFTPRLKDYVDRSLTEFITFTSGAKSMLQFYPFLGNGNISAYRLSFYKTWVSRLQFYQKRLGHRFFMEETIHIMHLSLSLHDANFFSKWLSSLIKRISFWKTRSIFRYLLYLFNNFFSNEFSAINCRGLKLRLKGKISAAGNSRKRSISLKFGKVSYSTLNIKCLRSNVVISTFTGAMNLRVEIFY